jgi:hypothetical protein
MSKTNLHIVLKLALGNNPLCHHSPTMPNWPYNPPSICVTPINVKMTYLLRKMMLLNKIGRKH